MPTLRLTVGERDRLDRQTRHRIQAAENGDSFEDDQPVLHVESYATLGRLLSPKNLALLSVIVEGEPPRIREAAELVDRGYKRV